MPYIVLVHVDDHTAEGVHRRGEMTGEMAASGRIVGLFRYPSKSEIGHDPSCKSTGWSRDRGGWMRCSNCKKRNPRIRAFLRNALFDFLGANLINDAPSAFKTPEGYGTLRHKS